MNEEVTDKPGSSDEVSVSRVTTEKQTRSFKLRFATQGEPGRSNLSAVRPLALPAPVTDKWYARSRRDGECGNAVAEEAAALVRVRERFARGPRDLYAHPVTSAQEYGWWWNVGAVSAAGRHHIRDSSWLRERLRLLAPDAAYKRR